MPGETPEERKERILQEAREARAAYLERERKLAAEQAEFDQQVNWRKVMTGPWAMLFCACRLPDSEKPRQPLLAFRPYEPLSAGCPVHGTFLMLHTGEVI